MTLKIYGIPASRAIRPLWAAEELGLAYENIPLHYASPEVKAAPYLKLNPNGLVPTIEDDGLVLFESLAITLHLARKHAAAGLWPADADAQSLALQWTLWAATSVEPLTTQWTQHSRMLPPERRRPELADEALQALARRFAVLEAQLAQRDYLLGKEFSVADLNLAAVLHRFAELGGERYAAAWDWHRRCLARPAARRAFALREQPAR
ncbi:glutathione S-transferase [Cupriavidus sp. USMAHM13]|uniref:Glutathione S-transferase n=1 Tax=Cupriavidus malaysiensis TaxID=367825 RepID=A0ABN4TRQ9_9BURK|nr:MULTISPECIES: glutathione S-transferase family protein [Cupriavidus]AOZ03640.1 glutathione S-transferase [Cupriavidus sp. USMAHM13]AOZ08996.1 glutathione S-transferase [Cupriavidus malaysiensis]